MAILLVHHKAPSWTKTNVQNLKVKLGEASSAEVKSQATAERQYDKTTLCLIKGEYAPGDLVQLGEKKLQQSHFIFTSADRKPSKILQLQRALPWPNSRRPDIKVSPESGIQYQQPEVHSPLPSPSVAVPAMGGRGTNTPGREAEEEDMDDTDLMLLEEEIERNMNLGEGEVTAIAMEYCVKQIAFGGRNIIQ